VQKGPSVLPLKQINRELNRFFHFCLLHTHDGQAALSYLYDRAIDLKFIQFFEIGYAPKDLKIFDAWCADFKIDPSNLQLAGALKNAQTPFFIDRITIPIKDSHGNVLGFTARKFQESMQGPKYVNTKETPLFKKSHILFGMYESRKSIVKHKKALIVEGQIDAMRLIYEGFDYTIAGQGTAFGEIHVQQVCDLGVTTVLIAFDGDLAGKTAAIKVGQLFLKKGVEVLIVALEKGEDPDTLLVKSSKEKFQERLDHAIPFLDFLKTFLETGKDCSLPAVKSGLVKEVTSYVTDWHDPLMRHEGKKKIAQLFSVPEELINVPSQTPVHETASHDEKIDLDLILEGDLVRWLIIAFQSCYPIAEKNLQSEDFIHPSMQKLFVLLKTTQGDLIEALSTEGSFELQPFVDLVLAKKVPIERAKTLMEETTRKILERNWLKKREEILKKMQLNGQNEQILEQLVIEFDQIKQNRPTLKS
jgi:DNA primase